MAEKKEEVKQEVLEYKLVRVPTNYELAIESPEGTALTTEQALVELLNKVNEIAKKL